jgi:putative copper resistance protein D
VHTPRQLITTSCGTIIAVKATVLVMLALLGCFQRRYIISRNPKSPTAFTIVAASELTLMATTVALAVGLTQTPPPT